MDEEGKRYLRIYLRLFVTVLLGAGTGLLCAGFAGWGTGLLGFLLVCCTSVLLYRLGELRKNAAETKKQLDETAKQLSAVQDELKRVRQALQNDQRNPTDES